MAHSIVGGTVEIGRHEVGEVIGGAEDFATLVVDIEERLEIGEPVGGMNLVDVLERQDEPVASGRRNIISGSKVPSMWTCSSALGSLMIKSSMPSTSFEGYVLRADRNPVESLPEAARIAADRRRRGR